VGFDRLDLDHDSLDLAATTNPVAKPLRAEDLFGDHDHEETLPPFPDDNAPTVTSMREARASEPPALATPPPSALPSVPVVRFSKSITVPPANAIADPSRPPPTTKQGIPPAPRPGIASEVASAAAASARAITAR